MARRHRSATDVEVHVGKASDRKLRLFACACCHRISHLITDVRSQKAVEITEQYADGLADRRQLLRARDAATEAKLKFNAPDQIVARRAASAVQHVTRNNAANATLCGVADSSRAVNLEDTNHFNPSESEQQANLLRCIVGNPFHSPNPDISQLRLESRVTGVANAIYDQRNFDGLPILADALEDTGWNDFEMLAHCRDHGPHARGCWVIDLILGIH